MFLVLAAWGILTPLVTSALPASASCEVWAPDPLTNGLVCTVSSAPSVPAEGELLEHGQPSAAVPAPPPEHLIEQPVLRTGPDGLCIGWRTADLGRPPLEPELLGVATQLFLWQRADIPMCPDAEAPAPLPAPEVVAAEVVRRMELPVPRPRIEPGKMLVGLRAYLETGGRTDFGHVEDTPLGPIEVTAGAVVHVDWGDGTVTGPHHSTGGPHPTGDITHVYQDSGRYDIVVRYEWVADWAVGGATGTIDTGLTTTATLPAFEIEQRQAVITSS
jgi:hypothetical protein